MPKPGFEANPTDIVILVHGITGAGLSTFVNEAIGDSDPKAEISRPESPQRTTKSIQAYRAHLFEESKQRKHQGSSLVFVDAPGLSGDKREDKTARKNIKLWLSKHYGEGTYFSGIMFLEDITDKRVRYSSLSAQLRTLCGDDIPAKVVFITTHWDEVQPDSKTKEEREAELKENHWKASSKTPSSDVRVVRLATNTRREGVSQAIDHILASTSVNGMQDQTSEKSKTWQNLQQPDDTFLEDGKSDDVVIAVMGPTGVGKSTFINMALRAYTGQSLGAEGPSRVGHGLESCTPNVAHYMVQLPDDHLYFPSRRLVMVDTPGFDDSHRDDSEILRRIGMWLAHSYSANMRLAGLVYLSDIEQKRMFGTARLNIAVFRELCGKHFSGIMLATTHWDVVNHRVAADREKELKENYWKELLAQGAKVSRVGKKVTDITTIVEAILSNAVESQARILKIQTELVDMEKVIPLTDAGTKLRRSLRDMVELQRRQLAGNGITDEERRQLEDQIASAISQADRLDPSVSDRLMDWLNTARLAIQFY